MQLVIAEKPSVARNIAKVLHATNVKDGYLEGKEYLVSWCIGHLIELASADQYRDDWKAWRYETLPMIPENWKYQIKESTKGQFRILKELLHRADVTEIICATDAGREGELIFRLVYNQAECKLPFKRLWISSMEEKAILEGFQQLKDGHEYDDLYYSAVARSEADWLVGINATRLFTVLYHHRLIVGRVQTPTLAMLVEREKSIENFQKEKYYLVHLLMDGLDAVSSRIKEKSAAVQMMEDMKDETAQILSVKKEKKKVQPPKLYDLTTLQREANRLLGFTAQQTLDYTQSLYEKKLVTYPRTDSQYLTDDMEENALLVVGAVNSMFPEMSIKGSEPDIKRLLNSKKVSDHHAIIPTVEITNMDLKALPGGEKEILMLIASKLLCASEQEYIYESIKTEISCHGELFTASGKNVLQYGWKEVEERFFKSYGKNAEKPEEEESDFPDIKIGQVFECVVVKFSEHFTAPPKHYTDAADVVPVPEEPPLYEAVKNELDADEVVKAKDLELETGSIFEVEKDFTGLEIPDEKKVKITFHEAKNEEKQDFTTDYEDTYKAVYYVEPVSGHPIYQINRKLIVKEAVVQVAESENQESVSNQEDENEAEGEEPAIGTAESEEPVQDEVNVEIPSEDEIYEEVTPTEIPVEEEPIDTPIPENPSEEVSTEEPAIDDNPDTDSTFEEITDTDPEEMPEATDDSFTDGTEKTEDADGNYQVNIVRGEEFHIELNHEDGQYQPGETVVFSGDMPQGSLIAVGTTKVQANQTENTEDLLYSEVTYHEESDKFSFEMPADDIDLSVSMDQAENGIMLLATDTPWDDATNIEANKYYYYSDGQLHPFDTVMGQGGNDSYKYVRYKAGGKTYTVNAYCMQHSMQSPPSGTTYKNMVELDEGGDDKYLRKALFYGYGGPGWGHTFNGYNVKSIMEKYGCSSETRAMQHYLVDYLYDGESGFGGALSTTAKNMLKEIKAALAKMPDPTAMKLLPGLSVNATGKETESFTWKANEAFTITIHLENGVILVNETTGKTASGNVTVKGGEKFHLVATTANIRKLFPT